MQPLRIGEFITLVFSTVMDELTRVFVDEDESVGTTTDRAIWENKATKSAVLIDNLLLEFEKFDRKLSPNYLKHYIDIERDGIVRNYVRFKPTNTRLNLTLKLIRTDETDKIIEDEGFELLNCYERWGEYTLRLT